MLVAWLQILISYVPIWNCWNTSIHVFAFRKHGRPTSTEQYVNIPGYECICKSRLSRRGGGLAVYVDSDINVTVKNRPDLDSVDSSVYESLIVQLSQPSVSANHLIQNVETFLTNFSAVLEKLSKENRPTYLLGDYNIDLLK